ncbi:MAG: hypothetical protein NTX13_19400 [Acidobacteria bacterium]|nr:hypothetical protein [Acidobacteriota bacterium]
MKRMEQMRSGWLVLLAAGLLAGQETGRLQIRVVAGEGALNNIKRKVAHNPEVVVTDRDGRPVAGAKVVFTFPLGGPSASVAGGRLWMAFDDIVRVADLKSRASRWQRVAREVKLQEDDLLNLYRLVIPQSNTLAGGREAVATGGGGRKLWFGLAAVAGGAAGVGVAATRGGGGGTAAAGTSLAVGGVSIGGPR